MYNILKDIQVDKEKNLTKYKNIIWFPVVTFVINNTQK